MDKAGYVRSYSQSIDMKYKYQNHIEVRKGTTFHGSYIYVIIYVIKLNVTQSDKIYRSYSQEIYMFILW